MTSSSPPVTRPLKRRLVSVDDILSLIGTHRRQIIIIIGSAFIYGFSSCSSMTLTLATRSLWTTWPELEANPVKYNIVIALNNASRLISCFLVLPLMDYWGRRTVFYFCFLAAFIMSPLTAACRTFAGYVVCRFLIGLFNGTLTASAILYSVEFLSIKRRAIPGILAQTAGCLSIVWATFMFGYFEKKDMSKAWRYAIPTIQIPSIVGLCCLALCPYETPRYLVANSGNTNKAWQCLSKLTKGGEPKLRQLLDVDETTPFQQKIRIQGDRAETNEKMPSFGRAFINRFKLMWAMLSAKEYRAQSWWLCLSWALQAFTHWGLAAYMTVFYEYIGVDVTLTTAGSFLIQLVGQLLCYLLVDRIGRVYLIVLFHTLTTIMMLTLAGVLRGGSTNKVALSALCMMCFLFSGPTWGIYYAYTAEIYPTRWRSTSNAVTQTVVAVSNIITSYVGSMTVSPTTVWRYPLIWGCMKLVAALVSLMLKKETAGKALDDSKEGENQSPNTGSLTDDEELAKTASSFVQAKKEPSLIV